MSMQLAHNDDAITIASGNDSLTTSTGTATTTSVGGQPPLSETLMSFVPLVLIFAVFYFFIMRPQIKKQKEHQTLIQGLQKGDKVVTSGGLMAKIVKLEDDDVMQAEIAPNVKVRMLRSSISEVLEVEEKISAKS